MLHCKHLFRIPPILVVWQRTPSRAGEFITTSYFIQIRAKSEVVYCELRCTTCRIDNKTGCLIMEMFLRHDSLIPVKLHPLTAATGRLVQDRIPARYARQSIISTRICKSLAIYLQ